MRGLNVYIDTAKVDVLREDEDLWQFQYDAKRITAPDGYDLVPRLPCVQSPRIDGRVLAAGEELGLRRLAAQWILVEVVSR